MNDSQFKAALIKYLYTISKNLNEVNKKLEKLENKTSAQMSLFDEEVK